MNSLNSRDCPSGTHSRTPLSKSQSLGIWAIIVATVGSQFVDITLWSGGGFVVSVQKIASFLLLPAGFLAIGRLKSHPGILAVGGLFVLSLVSATLFGGLQTPGLVGFVATALLNIIAASLLYTALTMAPGSISRFTQTWSTFATLSAAIAILQFVHVLPLLNVPAEYISMRQSFGGFSRSTGLKFDPNFEAAVLLAGLSFVRLSRGRHRSIQSLVLIAGIFCTMSRMGVLLAVLLMLASMNPLRLKSQDAVGWALRLVGSAAVVAVCGWIAYSVMPGSAQSYVQARGSDVTFAVKALITGVNSEQQVGPNQSSGIERASLARATIDLIRSHVSTGVGAGQVPEKMYELGFPDKAAHDTYLETAAIGGLFGMLTLFCYASVVLQHLRRAKSLGVPATLRHQAGAFMASFAIMAGLITFDYNSLFWLPLTVVVAVGSTAAGKSESRVTGAQQIDLMTAST